MCFAPAAGSSCASAVAIASGSIRSGGGASPSPVTSTTTSRRARWRASPGALTSSSGRRRARYGIVIERANGNRSAHPPDIPVCAASGASVAEIRERLARGLRTASSGRERTARARPPLREQGPRPTCSGSMVCIKPTGNVDADAGAPAPRPDVPSGAHMHLRPATVLISVLTQAEYVSPPSVNEQQSGYADSVQSADVLQKRSVSVSLHAFGAFGLRL